MKSQALQELVNKIFSDDSTRIKFGSDPESVLSEYALTEPEKRAVMSTHAKIGLVTSNSPQLEAALKPTMEWLAPQP